MNISKSLMGLIFTVSVAVTGCGGGGGGTSGDNSTLNDEATTTTGATTGDATTGDATTGDATTGDATTGDATTGDATTGDATTGDATTGDATTGDTTTGDTTTGDTTTGDGSVGPEENNLSNTSFGRYYGQTFDFKDLTFSVDEDGKALFEGDILLGMSSDLEENLNDEGLVGIAGVGAGNLSRRWPNGEVNFVIDASLTISARADFLDAVNHWEQNTPLRFFDKTSSTARGDHLIVMDSIGCSSYVGRQGGGQTVNLSTFCGYGAAVHEIGHAVGLFHEQSRSDRDQFVAINLQNVKSGKEHNFNQPTYDTPIDLQTYDCNSIMHYSSFAFSKNGQPTISPKTPECSGIGQRGGLSEGDVTAVNTLYAGFIAQPQGLNLITRDFNGDLFGDFAVQDVASFDSFRGFSVTNGVATYLGINGNQTDLVVRPYPFTSELAVNRFSTGDTIRGWSWDGSTASYVVYNSTDNKSSLIIRDFNGENFGPVQSEQFIATGDVIRGWNWDGARASYIVFLRGSSELIIRDFDGSTFSSNLSSRHISVSDPFRAWSWDGSTAYYIVTK